MKKLIITCCISIVLLIACSKDKDFKSEGYITGEDYRMCACCGGWYIEIDGKTYRFYSLPEDIALKLENESFPIAVQLDWTKNEIGCLGDEIFIEEIIKK